MATLGKNQVFEIKNGDGTSFHNLVLRKSAVESVVMSLGDKISGDVYYKDNSLSVTMHEYITYNGVNYMLVNPPTIVREGIVSDNSELKGMTKYSFVFYHPMCQLANFPFSDVAVTSDETRYLSEGKTFSWIGKPADFVAKLNKNLTGTEWIVELSSRFPQDKLDELSDVIPFDNATIADACKTFYDTWGVPYIVDKVASTETSYAAGKRFKIVIGLPSNEIYASATAQQQNTPYVFQMGHGVGLKNNSRTPRNNKIITRISGYGSENNIPYGYPQVRWYGTAGQSFTYGDHAGVYTDVTIGGVHFDKVVSYPIYKGILNGEYVELIKHPFTRTHLMPSVYRTTLFNKISLYNELGDVNTDYDPDITLVDFYDAVYSSQYPYPNTINLQAPSYESHEFEDEKPELGEAHIISATPLNNDLTPASSWDDSLDDEGNYKQSYFQIVLPQLSFDLYACASITEEMQINMRSGACLGCTFTVQVDWDDYKRNFYDEEGNFAPNGSQRDLTKYPKSNQGSISLVLQKDNSTFGTLMPNMYQYPNGENSAGANDGDTFVILGISLPESYILAAELRLDADMKSYMLENNVHYFDYPLKFDEDFLFHNENILRQIRPNTVVRFNYAGQTQALFVKQITIKYGEQALPQYDITLTDNVEVVLNQIGQVADDVEKLSTLIAILRQSYGKSVWNELAKKLSKTQDDTAAGYITMLKGLQVGANFVPDILGEGGVLRMREDGKVELVTDILYARMRAYFDSVVIREYRHESGNRIKSPAQGFNASRVEYIKVVNNVETIVGNASEADYFRCYWRVDDGEKKAENQFIIGDLAFCEHSDIVNGSLVTKRYWRVVRGRNAGNTTTADGEAWIDLSNAHDANGNPVMTTISWEGQGGATQTLSVKSFESRTNSYPEAHDDICMLGCTTDTTRQGAIIEYVSGVDAPTYQIYQGLGSDATNPYVLTDKNQITIGYNSATGKADMKVYGDAYIGDRDRNTYIEYKQDDGTPQHKPVFNIKANVTFTNTSEMSQFVKDNQNNYDDSEIKADISILDATTQDLQKQIDGAIETYYMEGVPALNLPPVVSTQAHPYDNPWLDGTETPEERTKILNNHIGDLYYDKETNHGYRFMFDGDNNVYVWGILTDEDVAKALADAAKAQDTADGKRTVYSIWDAWMKNNVNTLEVGDLFIPTNDYPNSQNPTYKARKVYKCTTKGSATFGEVNYTDDSAFNGYINAFLNGSSQTGDSYTAAAIQKAIAGALGSGTIVDGGLLLTSLIGMRQNTGTAQNPNYVTWGGISGQYDDWSGDTHARGHGIAAWYGGAMSDMEDMTDAQQTAWNALTPEQKAASSDWAKIVNRFDGSGYLASKNIRWTADGKVYLANIHSASGQAIDDYFFEAFAIGIDGTTRYINPSFSFSDIDIVRRSGAAYSITGTSVLNRNENDARYMGSSKFTDLFAVYNGDTDITSDFIASGLPTDVSNVSVKVKFNLWSQGGITALGRGSGGGGGGGSTTLYGLYDVRKNATEDGVYGESEGNVLTYNSVLGKWEGRVVQAGTDLNAVWNSLEENDASKQIHSSHLYNALSGYATQQWVGQQGYLTSIAAATDSALGGIKVGYTTSGKNYKVQLDSSNNAYVNVPWENTTYTLAGLMGSSTKGGTTQPIYWDGSEFKNTTYTLGKSVPSDAKFTDTTYSASTGLSLSGTAFSVSYAPKVLGSYTSNGGQQNPNYFGTNRVGFLMMNTTVNGNSQYKDWVIMDCYSGNDVGGGVAIGVNRQSLGAYIMRSAAARTSWAESAELIGTHNYTSYTVTKTGSGASGTWGINITGSAGSVAWGNVSGRPTAVSSFTNDSGYITSSGSCSYASSAGASSTVTINYNNDSNSTYQMLWGSGNYVYGTSGIYCNPYTDYLYSGSFYCGNWFRSSGNTGWYNESYGGGWYMEDTSWVRTYNGKGVVASGYYHTGYGSSAYALTSDGGAAHIGSMSVNYANSAGAVAWGNVTSKPSAAGDSTTPVYWTGSGFTSCTAYANASVNYANYAGYCGDGTHYIYAQYTNEINFGGSGSSETIYFGYRAAGSKPVPKEFVFGYTGNATITCGNVVSNNAVTAMSDERHKTVVGNTAITVEQIAKMPSVLFIWNDEMHAHDNKIYVGTLAQRWECVLPQAVSIANNIEGTRGFNYGVAALVAAITTARTVVNHEERIKALEKDNADLKQAYSFIKNAYDYLRMDYEQLKLRIA